MSVNTRRLILVATLGLLAAGRATAESALPAPVLTEQKSGTTARLQAVSVVSERVVWASGVRATWARTLDGGATWRADSMAGPDSWLEFRDVHAVSADRAWLLAAGPGDSSRIYHTGDGGRHWTLQFRNPDSSAFYDALDFWDARHGIVVGDAVRGHMMILTTEDGGATWKPMPADGMPPALPGEGAPAASGTCLVTRPGGRAWFCTESDSGARVYSSQDYGRTWRVAATPIAHGTASGVASLAMRDDLRGFAFGGRLLDNRDTSVAVAMTADGGRTWTAAARPPFTGPVYGSALLGVKRDGLLVTGPRGLALTRAGSAPPQWSLLSPENYWAVGASGNVAWAVGPGGRITRIGAQTAHSSPRGSFVVSKDGTRIAVECTGKGPDLLIVHGGTGDRRRWEPLMPLFATHFTVCAMDRRGHGESEPGTNYSLQKEFEDVVAVVNSRPGPVFVLGHSIGGVCALEAAFRSGKIAKLVLYEPPLQDLDQHANADRMDQMIQAGKREEALLLFLRDVVQLSPAEVARMQAQPGWPERVAAVDVQVRELRALGKYRFDARLARQLETPTLLLSGSETASPQLKQAVQTLMDSLPNRTLVVFQGQEHNAMDTIPQQFADTVTRFLEGRR